MRLRVVPALLLTLLALGSPASAARVVAVGDLHGNLDRFRAILREAKLIDARDRWIGDNAILVQTGDTLDRGPNSRNVLDLLMSLEQQAPASGGKAIVLLGNHEVMNMLGDLRYVSPPEWASYAGPGSEARRQAAYREYAKWFKRRYASGEPRPQKEWLAEHPAGFVEHRQAFAAKGKYGKWLRQHACVAQVEDSIFLHAGISPAAVPLSVKQLNDGVRGDLREYDAGFDLLLKRGAVLPFFTIQETVRAAREELAADRKESAARQAAPAGDLSSEDSLRQSITLLERFVALPTSLIGKQGPLLFRGFADWTDAEGEAELPRLLTAFQARRFVVGHTPQPERIVSRWDGRVFLIDTSQPQPEAPNGRASALEIDGRNVTAIYQGERAVLHSEPSRGPASAVSEVHEKPGGAVQEPAPAAQPYAWLDAAGNPLPFKSDEELLEFLRTAKVVSEKNIPSGVTSPHKLKLEKDGLQVNAIFRSVDEEKNNFVSTTGQSEMFFRDSYLFEPAAYELSQLLGLDNVPPATLRKLHGQSGSIQIWVEKAITLEGQRKSNAAAPDAQRWNKETQIIVLFDALVYNTDRNPGNILITPDGKAWMIDHTRAFRRWTKLPDERKIMRCDRALYGRLKALDATVAQQRLKAYLRPAEIKALLARRDLIVKRLDQLIAAQGENTVLFSLGQ